MSLNDYIYQYREYGHDADNLSDDDIIAMAEEEYDDIEDGMIYTHYNPNARWDWYSIGGRWRYMLRVYKRAPHIKDLEMFMETPRQQKGKYRLCDGARIKDIHFSAMNKPSNDNLKYWSRFWEVCVEGAEPKEGENFHPMYRPEYYRDLYGTKENFIMRKCTFLTYALLDDIEGKWYEQGRMGWFGTDDATQETINDYALKFYNILENPAYKDYWFIIVDCHI